MPTLHDLEIQPLDVILFRGVDAVSRSICFVEQKKIGHGDYSHAGIAVTRDVLDLDFLEPGRLYVWESTLSAPSGFWAKFTDAVPDVETEGVRFGVQLRDLELVVPAYEKDGGKVAWVKTIAERPPIEKIRAGLLELHSEYGHAAYDTNLLDLFAVVFPALRGSRDRIHHAQDRLVHFMNHVLEKTEGRTLLEDAEHHMFCSQWVATVLYQLGLSEKDPQLTAPSGVFKRPDLFATPVEIEGS